MTCRDLESPGQSSSKSRQYFLVKSLFDQRQFERILSLVEPGTVSDRDLLSLYLLAAHYVLLKKKASSAGPGAVGHSSKTKSTTGSEENLVAEQGRILREAEQIHSRFSNDSVICYLYALLVSHNPSEWSFASELLVRAIKLAPFNWAAWAELSRQPGMSLESSLSSFELYPFYKLERQLWLKQPRSVLEDLRGFRKLSWSYLDELEGRCQHELRDFAAASVAFERIIKRDRLRLSGMDEYSNCLFVLEKSAELSQLASHV